MTQHPPHACEPLLTGWIMGASSRRRCWHEHQCTCPMAVPHHHHPPAPYILVRWRFTTPTTPLVSSTRGPLSSTIHLTPCFLCEGEVVHTGQWVGTTTPAPSGRHDDCNTNHPTTSLLGPFVQPLQARRQAIACCCATGASTGQSEVGWVWNTMGISHDVRHSALQCTAVHAYCISTSSYIQDCSRKHEIVVHVKQ
jgi:hypothetical protein